MTQEKRIRRYKMRKTIYKERSERFTLFSLKHFKKQNALKIKIMQDENALRDCLIKQSSYR